MTRLLVATLALALMTTTANAAVLTWTGGGDGHSWNGSGNWSGGTRPGQTGDTLHITTTDTIDNVFRDAAGNRYHHGSTWRSIVNLNQGTIQTPTSNVGDRYEEGFESGSSGVFNIGDGNLTAGQPDAFVEIQGDGAWMFDRHGNGTFTVNVKVDGQLSAATSDGKLKTFSGHNGRKWVMNVQGGSVATVAAWNMSDGAGNDTNLLNLSLGGTVDVGAITVHTEIIDFADANLGNSFTADYGGSFANYAAVTAAIGSRFTSTGGGTLYVHHNGSSFTVDLIPAPAALPAGLALLGIVALRRRSA